MMRVVKFLLVVLALFILVSCGNGVTGGEPTQRAESPIFDPPEGAYESAQSVQIACATLGASIHFTTDGSTPTAASPVYGSAIAVNASRTIKAVSIKTGMADSVEASATYTIDTGGISLTKVQPPSFSPEGGTFDSFQEVTISTATEGASIYYTVDGSLPTIFGAEYTAPVSVAEDTTLKAIAVKSGMDASDVATAVYDIEIPLPQVTTPTFSPSPGYYEDPQTVEITCATPESVIHYTVNGTIPTPESPVYGGPIEAYFNMTLKAVAVKEGWADSGIASATYIINTPLPQVAAPVFDPPAGSYADDQLVMITSPTDGAVLHYTMDGTEPTEASPVYSSPLLINSSTTIRALGIKQWWINSTVEEATFTIEKEPEIRDTWTDPVTGMEFVWVPSGSFMMGDEFGEGDDDEFPVHRVTISQGFWMGKFEVTQSQWTTITGSNPSYYKYAPDGPSRPVELISWYDIQTFIGALNIRTGQNCRLPTEAEWEYAAKGAQIPGTRYSGTSDTDLLSDYAWYGWMTNGEPHVVGGKLPNRLGIYDMSGNVWEYVSDWYSWDYYSSSLSMDPLGPDSGSQKIVRGGSYYGGEYWDRNSVRGSRPPDEALYINIGFRLVRQNP